MRYISKIYPGLGKEGAKKLEDIPNEKDREEVRQLLEEEK